MVSDSAFVSWKVCIWRTLRGNNGRRPLRHYDLVLLGPGTTAWVIADAKYKKDLLPLARVFRREARADAFHQASRALVDELRRKANEQQPKQGVYLAPPDDIRN